MANVSRGVSEVSGSPDVTAPAPCKINSVKIKNKTTATLNITLPSTDDDTSALTGLTGLTIRALPSTDGTGQTAGLADAEVAALLGVVNTETPLTQVSDAGRTGDFDAAIPPGPWVEFYVTTHD